MLIAFHKPYGVLSQFTNESSAYQTLASFNFPKNHYPLGRLDADSEGLLLLSNESGLNDRLLNPKNQHPRTYWAQVEGIPQDQDLTTLRLGTVIQGLRCLPCQAKLLTPAPLHTPRIPPIRERKNIPVSWLELKLIEGKNRQVRRMTASIGFPTLRLIRSQIGGFSLGALPVGQWIELNHEQSAHILEH